MAKWGTDYSKATSFKVSGYIDFYASVSATTSSGRLKPDTTVGLTYDSSNDVMKIVSCKSPKTAVGKYLLSPENSSGNVVVKPVTTSSGSTVKATTEATTTVSTVTNDVIPSNVDGDGSESGSDSSLADNVYIDDAFVSTEYSTYTNSDQYYSNLSEGLEVKDLRGILGMPHQFLPTADPRIDGDSKAGSNSGFGRVYSEKIIKHIPLLLMTPGTPSFMGSFSDDQKTSIVNAMTGIAQETIESLLGEDSGKYYSLKYAYTEYFHYVNAMLRSAAYYLGIQDTKVDGKRLGSLNWLYQTSSLGSDIFGHGKLANFLGPYAGCIAFYADAGTTVDESFSNSTGESQLASSLNNLSDQGRELNFLVGNIGSEVGLQLTAATGQEQLESNMASVQETIGNLLGTGNVISSILNKAQTILAGGRIIFPEIWTDSSFSRSYSCSMKLVSPSGDKLSVFLNILVPIYHLLAFTLPRQSIQQLYFSPFLVRAYYKGLFNVDMGIIPGLSITKGDEGEWTLDGIPTVANVSFEIKDLYSGMFMSPQKSDKGYENIMSNIQELDYIANSCGVNVNDQEVFRTIKMYAALGFTTNIKDKITIDIFGGISQYFNQKMNNIFGVF
jgi:hypothetical protein